MKRMPIIGLKFANTVIDTGFQLFNSGGAVRTGHADIELSNRTTGKNQPVHSGHKNHTMSKKAKVLIIVQNLPVPFDRRVWLEAQTLQKNGCRVSVISPKSAQYTKKFECIEGISVYRYEMPLEAKGVFGYFFEFIYAWLATALLSLRVLLNEGFDVIQACNPPDTYFLLAAFYKLFGKKFVFDHHDLSPEMFSAKFSHRHPVLLKALCVLERLTIKTADIIISTNESYKKMAVCRGRRSPQDVYVLRTGPDLTKLKLYAPNPFFRHGKTHLVTYLGEMCSQDGVDYMLSAVDYIVHTLQRHDIQFVLLGGGPAMPDFAAMSRSMGLDEWVRFTGRVSDEVLSHYLSTSDLCIAPDPKNSWTDSSTMNKVLEYMSFAKPVISFDLKETRVSAGDAAFYVEPNDTRAMGKAVLDLLSDPISRQYMGYKGYKRVHQKLSWKHTQRHLLEAYARFFPLSIPEPVDTQSESIPVPGTLEFSMMASVLKQKLAGGE